MRFTLVLIVGFAQLAGCGGPALRETVVFPSADTGCRTDCAAVASEGEVLAECGSILPDTEIRARLASYSGQLTVCRFEVP